MTAPGRALAAERLRAAMNAHDIDAFVDCFAEDYDSEQPAHPDRAFTGRDQVRVDASGDVEWSEWRRRGTGLDMAVRRIAGGDD